MSVPPHGSEAYGMREMSGVGPGEIYDPYGGGAAGAAGIGVARARSTKADGGFAAGLQDGSAPYAAFAVPAQQHDPYASQIRGVGRDTNTNADILEAAGMGAHVAGAGMMSRSQSQYKNAYNSQYQPYPSQAQPQYGGLHQRSPSQLQQAQELEYANMSRGKSLGSRDGHGGALPLSATSVASSGATQYFSPVADSYQSHSYAQGGQQNPPQAVAEEDMDDAYGGYVAGEHQGGAAVGGAPAVATAVSAKGQSALSNPFEAGSSTSHGKQEYDERDSQYSDEEEEAPKRVLKVRFLDSFFFSLCKFMTIRWIGRKRMKMKSTKIDSLFLSFRSRCFFLCHDVSHRPTKPTPLTPKNPTPMMRHDSERTTETNE